MWKDDQAIVKKAKNGRWEAIIFQFTDENTGSDNYH